MKRYLIPIFVVLLLAILAAFLLLNRSRSTLSGSDSDFAIRDTASLTRIFIADRSGNSIELSRPEGTWIVNNDVAAREDAVNQLLATMMRMAVKAPVAKTAHNSVIKRLASTGVKVEVYQEIYRIDLPGIIRLFPREKISRTFYVGDNTQDNMGTFMLLEGSERPYIVYLPGFRGFIATRFSARVNDWRDHTIFKKRLTDIKSASLVFTDAPEKSYTVEVINERRFRLTRPDGYELPLADTMKIVGYLAAFDDIRYESLLSGDLPQTYIDSVRQSPVYQTITLTDLKGETTVVETHRRIFKEPQDDIDGNPQMYDRDRMYAFINGGDDMVLIQYFVFDRITRPLAWFLPEGMIEDQARP